MNCRAFREWLNHLAVEPVGPVGGAAGSHLLSCRRCAAAYAAETDLARLLARLKQSAVSIDVMERILNAIQSSPAPVAAVRTVAPGTSHRLVVAILASAALLLWWLFPAREAGMAVRLLVEQAPGLAAQGLERLAHAGLWVVALLGRGLMGAALLLLDLFKWLNWMQAALPNLPLVNSVLASTLAGTVAWVLRRQAAERRIS